MGVLSRLAGHFRRVALTIGVAGLLSTDVSLQTSNSGSAVITETMIRANMEFLASDAMKGRGSGTEDEWRAAVYIGSQLRRWGIEPLGDAGTFVQRIENGRMQTTAPPVLTSTDLRFTHGKEMLVQTLGRGNVTGSLFKYVRGGTGSSRRLSAPA